MKIYLQYWVNRFPCSTYELKKRYIGEVFRTSTRYKQNDNVEPMLFYDDGHKNLYVYQNFVELFANYHLFLFRI